mgnify:CR=1 FL=1
MFFIILIFILCFISNVCIITGTLVTKELILTTFSILQTNAQLYVSHLIYLTTSINSVKLIKQRVTQLRFYTGVDEIDEMSCDIELWIS